MRDNMKYVTQFIKEEDGIGIVELILILVILIFRIPSSSASVHIFLISSYVRISDIATCVIPSGIQYLHLKLHRSVIEILI